MATNFNELNSNELNELKGLILSNYANLTVNQLSELIQITTVKGCKFVSLKGYKSSTDNSVSDLLINVGASYENQLSKDSISIENVVLNEINISDFDYLFKNVDTKKLSLSDFKTATFLALPLALNELKEPKKKANTDNSIRFNSVLSYNTNTNNFLIYGTVVKKVIIEKGDEPKMVASAPKTIAKKIINKFIEARTAKIRTYKIDNLCSMKINSEELTFE